MSHLVNSSISGMPGFLAPTRKRLRFESGNGDVAEFDIGEPVTNKRSRTGVTSDGNLYCSSMTCDGTVDCAEMICSSVDLKTIQGDTLNLTGDLTVNNVNASGDLNVANIAASGTIVAQGQLASYTGISTGGTLSGGEIKCLGGDIVAQAGNIITEIGDITSAGSVTGAFIESTGDLSITGTTFAEGNLNVAGNTTAPTISCNHITFPGRTGSVAPVISIGNQIVFTDTKDVLNLPSNIYNQRNISTNSLTSATPFEVDQYATTGTVFTLSDTTTEAISNNVTNVLSTYGYSFVAAADCLVHAVWISTLAPIDINLQFRYARLYNDTGDVLFNVQWNTIIPITTGYFGVTISTDPPCRIRAGYTYTVAMQVRDGDQILVNPQTPSPQVSSITPLFFDGDGQPMNPPFQGNSPNVTFGLNLDLRISASALHISDVAITSELPVIANSSLTTNSALVSNGTLTTNGALVATNSIQGTSISLSAMEGVIVRLLSQTIPTGIPTAVTQFASLTTGILPPLTWNGSTWSLTVPGLYALKASVSFESNATGTRFVRWNNEANHILSAQNSNATNGDRTSLSTAAHIYSQGTSTVQVVVFQDSGGDLDIGDLRTEVSVVRLH